MNQVLVAETKHEVGSMAVKNVRKTTRKERAFIIIQHVK